MEGTLRWVLVTAIAPVAWGSNYYVTREFLPAGHPLYGGVLRAVPAGLLLLVMCRRFPHGAWWWRSLVLGTLNMGAFFALIYLAAQLLPTSIAATVMATSPVVMMLVAWLVLAHRPPIRHLAGAGVGIVGVALLLFTGAVALDVRGVLASVAAMVMSSFGYVLAKWWSGEVDVLSLTCWQLVAGGLVLLAVALAVEGAPPVLDGPAVYGFGYVAVVATALAFVAWFAGLRHLDAGTVGLVGLLNPVTGVLLGTVIAADAFTARQACGMALVLAAILLGRPVRRCRRGRSVRCVAGDGQARPPRAGAT
jgi:probable blue pigment (indigoidine) exporter